MNSPKDNDELRQAILKKGTVRMAKITVSQNINSNGTVSPLKSSNQEVVEIGIDDLMHFITTHTLRALERARMWEQYAGDYEKRYYDIKLWSGEVYENCWPNANTFHEGVIGKLIEGKDVAYVRPSQTPQLNHQKSQKEGE